MNTLLYREYKFKFYLNANHYITIGGKRGDIHPHTWEFAFDILLNNEEFVRFNQIEKAIDQYFEKFQNKLINDFEPFDKMDPTLENMSEQFIMEIRDIIDNLGGTLVRMESSETPTRSYIISFEKDQSFIDRFITNTDKKIDELVDLVSDRIINGDKF